MDAKKKPAGKVKAAEPAAAPAAVKAAESAASANAGDAAIPYAVAALAIAHGYDPNYLMAWSCWDGKAVIIGPDGKKYRE
jgi:hypothetical protein